MNRWACRQSDMPRRDGPTTPSCPLARNLAYLSVPNSRARDCPSSGSSALQRPILPRRPRRIRPQSNLFTQRLAGPPSGKLLQGRPPCTTHQLNSALYRASRLRPQAGVQVASLSHRGGCLHRAARLATPEHSLAKYQGQHLITSGQTTEPPDGQVSPCLFMQSRTRSA